MNIRTQALKAAYESGRPFSVLDADGWNLLLWNTGAGTVTLGMWKEGKEPVIRDWRMDHDEFRDTRTSTLKLAVDIWQSRNPQVVAVQSWVIDGYGDNRRNRLPLP